MKVSEGCKNCYAETLAVGRYKKPIWGPPKTTARERKKAVWTDIVKWDTEAKFDRIRRRVFVSSMSDFLEDHPQVESWRKEAMDVIGNLKWLDVLILTKRPENYRLLEDWLPLFPSHVWMGASIENEDNTRRIEQLINIPAKIHFLSVEPMLEPVLLDFHSHIDWVIVGGESGPKCRPFEWDWARDLRDQCISAGIAFFMKQGGGHPNPRHNLEDIPEDLRIREFPG